MTGVKICGLKEPETVRAAANAGADWIGFSLVPASPRAVTIGQADLLLSQTSLAQGVALVSDADDALIDAIRFTGFSILQLHGSETPKRVAEIKARTGAEIWKAIGVSRVDDLTIAAGYEAADRMLIDARPPEGASRTGGHGAAFDWSILENWKAPKPWILAGGLTPANVADAITETCASAVDVSSGVETSPGVKNIGLIDDFIRIAKGL